MAAYKDDGKLWVLVADEGVARLAKLMAEVSKFRPAFFE